MFIYLIIFLFGLCVGSLLNAVIYRLEKGESVIAESRGTKRGTTRKMARSYCPHCKHVLAWIDLVPVLSFLLLRRRCRYCNKKISVQYPIVEIVTGILFVFIVWYVFDKGTGNWELGIGNLFYFCYMLYVICSMIIIFVYDLKYYLIPDKIVFPAIMISLVFRILNLEFISDFPPKADQFLAGVLRISDLGAVSEFILSAIIASGFFLSLIIISKGRWMGMGDVKLAFLMGLVLGWPNIMVALFFAFLSGALIGLALVFVTSIYRGRKPLNLKSQIPFGPFLIAGTFVAMFWGQKIAEWYLGLLLF